MTKSQHKRARWALLLGYTVTAIGFWPGLPFHVGNALREIGLMNAISAGTAMFIMGRD